MYSYGRYGQSVVRQFGQFSSAFGMNDLRREVLKSFKKLHIARKKVFREDQRALNESRKRINAEYAANKHVKDKNIIRELIIYSNEVEKQLLTTVIQAKMVSPNKFEARITEDTVKLDNVPFKDCCENVRK